MQSGISVNKVLIVEDEPKIARLLIDYLMRAGFEYHWLDRGAPVTDYVRTHKPDIVLLDITLPELDGLSICREIRTFSAVPILMITARVEEIDRLLGLELGADDYICKPFSPREVIARIKAILRRIERPEPHGTSGFHVDDEQMLIRFENTRLDLTRNEYRLLKAFISQPGRVFSRDNLIDYAYDDYREINDRTIDSHIKNLRKKISEALPGKQVIYSVYGVGYRFEP